MIQRMISFSYVLVLLLGISTATLFGASKSSHQNKDVERPNIIMVITDDQGSGDLACSGNPYVKTPNIDKFYEESVRFTNYHVSTTCAPTRGALMTGRHSNRINVFHTISGRSLLFEDEVLISQVLAQNGYTNGMFGKWHLGDNYPYRPEDRGFHEVVRHGGGGITQGPDFWGNDYFDDTYWHNGETQKYTGYCTDVFFLEALNFIENNKDHPFFCYISTNAPHKPLNLPEDYLKIYENVEGLSDDVKRFYGMISNIDDNFKTLEDKLDELGLTDNTILIFTTDNGTASGRTTFNAGLRGGKGSEYDGGHRVPLFIRWPNGELVGGKDIEKLVVHCDLFPTFVDLLHLDFNPVKPLDGKSLKPLLYDNGVNWENRVWYMDTQRLQNLIKNKNYAVMDDNWRLINGNELYDMHRDRGQRTNVIDQYPEVAARLAEGYEFWWRSFVEDGEYSISLRRFPRESGLAINATFPAQEPKIELDRTFPASVKADFETAYLYVANISGSKKIEKDQDEVTFTGNVPAGKYDMEAQLIDSEGRVYPAYYVYIEKL